MQEKIKNLKKYWCEREQRNYWMLDYFGGSGINITNANQIAIEFQAETQVPFDTIYIDEIQSSRRFKHCKVLYTLAEKQFPLEDAERLQNVWQWLTD